MCSPLFLAFPESAEIKNKPIGCVDRMAEISKFLLIAFRAHCIMPLPPVGVDDAWVRYL